MMIPTTPQTLTQVVKTGISLWRITLKQTFPFGLIFAITSLAFHFLFPPISIQQNTVPLLTPKLFGNVGLWVAFLIILVWLHAALVTCINQAAQGHYLRFHEIIYSSLQRVYSLSLVMILSFSAIGVGFLFFIIPGLILSVFFIFSAYIVVIEEKGVIASIRESFKLVAGNWWYTMSAFSTVSLIYFIIAFLFNLIGFGLDFLFLMMVENLFAKASGVKVYVTSVTNGLIIALLYPLYHACIMAMFYDLRLKKKRY
jgi:hypothetical protein